MTLLLIVAAALYFLKVNLLSADIFTNVTALGIKWVGKEKEERREKAGKTQIKNVQKGSNP